MKERGLLIAEKPSLRRTIEGVYKKHAAEIAYEITFMEQRGHLLTLKLPDEMDASQKKWSWEKLPFRPEDCGGWQYKVIPDKKKGNFLTSRERYNAIKKELDSGKYSFVINAGDPDQEGELLIRVVLAQMGNRLPVKRYWSNDTTEKKVLEALKALRDDDKDPMLVNLLAAAYGRQHSDYRFGMNLSRAATLKMGTRVACGRVKTPIMGIVCKREKEIEDFKPSTCYGIQADYEAGFSGKLYEASPQPSDEKEESAGIMWFDTEEEARGILKKLHSPAKVVAFSSERIKTSAPKLFKLATAQIAAGKLGLNSSDTLSTIQSLYEKGYLTYPRTDCEYLSSGEDLQGMLKAAASVPGLERFIGQIDPVAIEGVKRSKRWISDEKLKESGHSALAPTVSVPHFAALSEREQLIYRLICTRFAAVFLPPLVQDKTVLVTDIGGYLFKSTGKTLVDAGYTEALGKTFADAAIPAYKKGDVLKVGKFDVSTKTATCPKRFTDADLIAVCEAPHKYLADASLKELGKRLKIGTPATRAGLFMRI